MLRRKARRGLATLCVTGGMGMAMAIEVDFGCGMLVMPVIDAK